MKTKLILGSFLALSGMASAQWSFSCPPTTTCNVGIGVGTPLAPLHVQTSVANTGITITQSSSGSNGSRLLLENKTTGGRDWAFYSLGAGNSQGAGNFLIYDQGSATDRLLINGSTGNVGIGTSAPSSKLHVVGSATGVRGDATNSAAAYAVQGVANGVSGSGQTIGVSGSGGTGSQNFGGFFTGVGNGVSATAMGVYGRVVNAAPGDWAGYFLGDVFASGAYTSSDRKLKDNIQPLNNALDKINQLKPSTYTFKTSEFKDMNLPAGEQMGLIAQDLEQVFPALVKDVASRKEMSENGEVTGTTTAFKCVNYTSLIPVLIAGMQEQQKQIEAQQALIDQLMNKSNTATGINQLNNAALNGFALEQNVPNPFNNETVIKYTLPEQVNAASLVVYDLSGKQITAMPLTQKGSASISITSEKLAAGIYIYSVMADGKILDSKRMVVAQK